MVRYVSTLVCALAGASALVLSAFGQWTELQDGKEVPLSQLWKGLGPDTAGPAESLFVPLVVAAVLALVGVLTKVRLAVALAGLIGLATTGLFMLQQGRAESGFDHFYQGWTNAAGGAMLLITAAVLLPGRLRTGKTVHSQENQ